VNLHSFAWPGEYSAGKPTWPMRWYTGGGVIAEADMEKLAAMLAPAVEAAEQQGVDLVFSQESWIYTNTTVNFRRVAERLGSSRVKVMWTPADNLCSGEPQVETAGFLNVRPYLHSLHLKNLRIFDGAKLQFEYCSLADGEVDYVAVLRNLRDSRIDAVLALAAHFQPPGGSNVDAMYRNAAELREMIARVEAEDL
jgi:sugar phosphate isomerase/epimerase